MRHEFCWLVTPFEQRAWPVPGYEQSGLDSLLCSSVYASPFALRASVSDIIHPFCAMNRYLNDHFHAIRVYIKPRMTIRRDSLTLEKAKQSAWSTRKAERAYFASVDVAAVPSTTGSSCSSTLIPRCRIEGSLLGLPARPAVLEVVGWSVGTPGAPEMEFRCSPWL